MVGPRNGGGEGKRVHFPLLRLQFGDIKQRHYRKGYLQPSVITPPAAVDARVQQQRTAAAAAAG